MMRIPGQSASHRPRETRDTVRTDEPHDALRVALHEEALLPRDRVPVAGAVAEAAQVLPLLDPHHDLHRFEQPDAAESVPGVVGVAAEHDGLVVGIDREMQVLLDHPPGDDGDGPLPDGLALAEPDALLARAQSRGNGGDRPRDPDGRVVQPACRRVVHPTIIAAGTPHTRVSQPGQDDALAPDHIPFITSS